ncbi:MarR family winged helix-turn-helix transcriptional regulator [Streptomyces sp. NPDC050085]|uniref:MarR family winged helix-turn-helix transcriptional regulator n=1 Tax=Streptomyces sp. NPDC050085 TaxID=3365600 RepID=UPI0037A2C3F3
MNGVELFLLGRTLMKIGEAAMPEPEGGSAAHAGSTRAVLIVASDIATHPDTAASEIATRTGLPQSQVSTSVARLKEAGAVTTTPDPTDRRRALIRQAPQLSARVKEVRATTIDDALTTALADSTPQARKEVTAALETLARHLTPQATARFTR